MAPPKTLAKAQREVEKVEREGDDDGDDEPEEDSEEKIPQGFKDHAEQERQRGREVLYGQLIQVRTSQFLAHSIASQRLHTEVFMCACVQDGHSRPHKHGVRDEPGGHERMHVSRPPSLPRPVRGRGGA